MAEDSASGGDGYSHLAEERFAQSMQHSLEQTGELCKLKAAIRSTIMNVIRGGDTTPMNKVRDKYRTRAIDLCNGLLMDFLHWSGYHYSMEMFATESGTKASAADRRELGARLKAFCVRNCSGDSGGQSIFENGCADEDIPLLLNMVVQSMGLPADEAN